MSSFAAPICWHSDRSERTAAAHRATIGQIAKEKPSFHLSSLYFLGDREGGEEMHTDREIQKIRSDWETAS